MPQKFASENTVSATSWFHVDKGATGLHMLFNGCSEEMTLTHETNSNCRQRTLRFVLFFCVASHDNWIEIFNIGVMFQLDVNEVVPRQNSGETKDLCPSWVKDQDENPWTASTNIMNQDTKPLFGHHSMIIMWMFSLAYRNMVINVLCYF